MDIFDITASALTAQRMRMDTIASNLANVNTTRQENGEKKAYRRKNVSFSPLLNQQMASKLGSGQGADLAGSIPMRPAPASISVGSDGRVKISTGISQGVFRGAGVQVSQIGEDNQTPMKQIYDPSHPDANNEGWVEMPNVNPITEMVDMISATRAYEANVTSMQSAKSMLQAALEM